MAVDPTKIRAQGPWILIKPEAPKNVTKGGIYMPDGNLLERLGHTAGVVVSASPGHWEKVKAKTVFVPNGLNAGDRVIFRGHLQEALQVEDHCFVHIRDLIGVLDGDTELEPSLPYG